MADESRYATRVLQVDRFRGVNPFVANPQWTSLTGSGSVNFNDGLALPGRQMVYLSGQNFKVPQAVDLGTDSKGYRHFLGYRQGGASQGVITQIAKRPEHVIEMPLGALRLTYSAHVLDCFSGLSEQRGLYREMQRVLEEAHGQ